MQAARGKCKGSSSEKRLQISAKRHHGEPQSPILSETRDSTPCGELAPQDFTVWYHSTRVLPKCFDKHQHFERLFSFYSSMKILKNNLYKKVENQFFLLLVLMFVHSVLEMRLCPLSITKVNSCGSKTKCP